MADWIKSFYLQNPDKARWPVYKREQYSLHLVRPDGKIEANFTGAPMHQDEDVPGVWEPLSTTLVLRGGEYGAKGLKTRIGLDGTVRIEGGTYSHRSTRIGIFDPTTKTFSSVKTIPLGKISDDSIISTAGVFQRVIRLTETGCREKIVISALPTGIGAGANDWLVLETAISGVSFADGWLDEFNADDFRFPPPRTVDANMNEANCKRYARNVGGVQYIYTGVPVSWLAGATYPVTIDPDFTAGEASATLKGNNATFAIAHSTCAEQYSNQSQDTIGQDSVYRIYRVVYKFNTSSIGGATVTQANLNLVCTSDASDTNFIIEIVEQDWSAQDPITSGNMDVAYDGCLVIDAHYHWQNTYGITTGTIYTSDNLTTNYVNGAGNTYYSIRSDRDKSNTTPTGNEFIYTAGPIYATVAYRPILTVVYTVPGTAALTGTATAGINEADIVAGGKTIIVTLTGDTWVATVGADNAITTALIAGIDSAQSETHGWDAEVKAKLVYTNVVRTSSTVVTVTLPAEAAYNITATETITVTIPASAVTLAAQIVATPTFTVAYIPTAIKTILGLAVASVKTRNGLAMSSVKSINGLQ